MTDNYKKLLEKGQEFQDFLMRKLIEYGIIIMPYSSRKYQYEHGESYTRHEIKFDDKFKTTGNLYIEIAEKTNSSNINWINSGIMREDNTLWFVIGNYDEVFIFQKNILKMLSLSQKNAFSRVSTGTSKGILVPLDYADKYSIHIKFKN